MAKTRAAAKKLGNKNTGTKPGKKPNTRNTGQKTHKKSDQPQFWTQEVTETSDALDLEEGVFTQSDPREIALSLQRSAEASDRRKTGPFRSAMSMLVFFINRAGRNLPVERRNRLEAAKDELRKLYGKPTHASAGNP